MVLNLTTNNKESSNSLLGQFSHMRTPGVILYNEAMSRATPSLAHQVLIYQTNIFQSKQEYFVDVITITHNFLNM